MNLVDIMTKDPVCVLLDDRLYKVKEIFDRSNFHHLLVIDEGKLIGILSDRDLLRNISPNIGTSRYVVNDLDTLDQPVHKIVTRKPIVLTCDDKLKDAIEIFNNHKISCIPIVDENKKPLGVISWRDILRYAKFE